MILVTCLNPALDVTYQVPTLTLGRSHRVRQVTSRAGGKGTNVVRVLAQLGTETTLLAGVGGPTGEAFSRDLGDSGQATSLVPLAGETRRTVTITSAATGANRAVDERHATAFNEPGPHVDKRDWTTIRTRFQRLVENAHLVVLSGSLPPGAPVDGYACLIEIAHEASTRVVLDADGPALVAALQARPALVKVNASEAAEALDVPHHEGRLTDAQRLQAPEGLVDMGAEAAVVTHGPDGLVAVVGGRRWHARIDTPIAGNPTGAGDALTAVLAAGLAVGLSADQGWTGLLREAVAISGAAVAIPYAGAYDQELAAELRPTVVVEEL